MNTNVFILPGNSTVHQLIEIYHRICLSLEERQHTCLIVCDISKAFDRVWPRGLITKLRSYGFNGDILSWPKVHITKVSICNYSKFCITF